MELVSCDRYPKFTTTILYLRMWMDHIAREGTLARPRDIGVAEHGAGIVPGTPRRRTSYSVSFGWGGPSLPLLSGSWAQPRVKSAHPECFGTSVICSDATSLCLVHADCEQIQMEAFINDNTKWDHCIVYGLQACHLQSRPGRRCDAKVQFRAGTNLGFHSFT